MTDQRASAPAQTEQLVYVVPESLAPGKNVDLSELLAAVREGGRRLLLVSLLTALGFAAYALLAEEWYTAEALLAPAEQAAVSPGGSQLGGLAALAGVPLSLGEQDPSVKALAILRSREFARRFIDAKGLLAAFTVDRAPWWRGLPLVPQPSEDLFDAVEFFQRSVLAVTEDPKTGFVTLSVTWTDRDTAAAWAQDIFQRLNAQVRALAIEDAERNVAFLKEELRTGTVAGLQPAINSLAEAELQQLMLAKGREAFAFELLDPPTPPKYRSAPNRTLLVLLGGFLGFVLPLMALLARVLWRQGARAAS